MWCSSSLSCTQLENNSEIIKKFYVSLQSYIYYLYDHPPNKSKLLLSNEFNGYALIFKIDWQLWRWVLVGSIKILKSNLVHIRVEAEFNMPSRKRNKVVKNKR